VSGGGSGAPAHTVRVLIRGRVQGVAYRAWTKRAADELGLTGWVRNRRTGEVEAVFCGPADVVERIVAACRQGPRLAQVESVEVLEGAERERDSAPAAFTVLETR
jgi:acylphosphatase